MMIFSVTGICAGEVAVKKEITEETIRLIVKEEVKKSVGFFDPYKVLEQSDEYKDGRTEIEKELEKRSKELRSIEDAFIKKNAEYEKMITADLLNDSAKDNKKEELIQLKAQGQAKMQNAQEYAEMAEQKLRMKVLQKIHIEAESLAKEKELTVMLAGGIVYGDKACDYTAEIAGRLNKKYKAEKEKQKKIKEIEQPA